MSNTEPRIVRATRVAKLVGTVLRLVLLALAVRARIRQERAEVDGIASPERSPIASLREAMEQAMEGLREAMADAGQQALQAQRQAAERAAAKQES